MTIRLVSYNIRFGGRARESIIADVLGALDPDLVVLQEATDPAVVGAVAATLGLSVVAVQRGASVAVIGRVATAGVRRVALRTGRTCVALELPAQGVRLYGVHLSAGLSRRGEVKRLVEADELLRIVTADGGPDRSIVLGDLNAISPTDGLHASTLPRWIRLLLRVDGGIQTAVLPRLTDAGFVDAYRHLDPAGPGRTMPSSRPSVRLDYLLVGTALADSLIICEPAALVGSSVLAASDHLPLVAELALGAA